MLLRPLAEPLPLALQVRGRQAREPLDGLNAHEQLELACRSLAGILAAARSRFAGRGRIGKPTICSVTPWKSGCSGDSFRRGAVPSSHGCASPAPRQTQTAYTRRPGKKSPRPESQGARSARPSRLPPSRCPRNPPGAASAGVRIHDRSRVALGTDLRPCNCLLGVGGSLLGERPTRFPVVRGLRRCASLCYGLPLSPL